MSQEKEKPKIVTQIVRNFKYRGKKNSVEGLTKSQVREAPAKMAPKDSRKVGIVQKISLSLIGWRGREREGAHSTERRNRAVYLAVRPVAKKNKRTKM